VRESEDKFVHYFTPRWRDAPDRSIVVGMSPDGMHLVQAAVVDGRGGGEVPNVQQHVAWVSEAVAHFRRTGQSLGTEAKPWQPKKNAAPIRQRLQSVAQQRVLVQARTVRCKS
jgi:hypothetical protein